MGHYNGKWTCKECQKTIEDGIDGVGVISGRGVGVCRECAPAYLKDFIELAKSGAFDHLFDEGRAAPSVWTYVPSAGTLTTTNTVTAGESSAWYSVHPDGHSYGKGQKS